MTFELRVLCPNKHRSLSYRCNILLIVYELRLYITIINHDQCFVLIMSVEVVIHT